MTASTSSHQAHAEAKREVPIATVVVIAGTCWPHSNERQIINTMLGEAPGLKTKLVRREVSRLVTG